MAIAVLVLSSNLLMLTNTPMLLLVAAVLTAARPDTVRLPEATDAVELSMVTPLLPVPVTRLPACMPKPVMVMSPAVAEASVL